jgi:hypothetical protein
VLLDFGGHTAISIARNIVRLEVTTELILRIQVLWFLLLSNTVTDLLTLGDFCAIHYEN